MPAPRAGSIAMADIPRQLAALLGRETVQVRKTDETPPRISVIDVISAISGHNSSNAARAFARLGHDYPDVTASRQIPRHQGQKGTARHARDRY